MMLSCPCVVKLCNDSCSINMISVVEMVIIVKPMTKVLPGIGQRRTVRKTVATVLGVTVKVAATRHHAAPVVVEKQRRTGRAVDPNLYA